MKHQFWICLFAPGLFTCNVISAMSQKSAPEVKKAAKAILKKDLSYAHTDNPKQQLDLMLPAVRTSKGPLPVIVFIHGGGWRNGDKSGGHRELQPYVESGEYAGVSVAYRLSKEAKWPAQIHDCKAAIRWIRGNAEKYGIDPNRIGVMGTSAGGHLVSMLGTTAGVDRFEGKLGEYLDQKSDVQCVINLFGPSDFLTMNDYPSAIDHLGEKSPESQLLGKTVKEHPMEAKDVSPLTHVSQDDAPMLHIHGKKDPLVPWQQSEVFHNALLKVKVESETLFIPDGRHGGFKKEDYVPQMKAFFLKHLQKNPKKKTSIPAS